MGDVVELSCAIAIMIPQLFAAVSSAWVRHRRASSILNPFSLRGFASRKAASAAFRKLAALAGWPASADSASGDRHGLVPTPPNAIRALVTVPLAISRMTAA